MKQFFKNLIRIKAAEEMFSDKDENSATYGEDDEEMSKLQRRKSDGFRRQTVDVQSVILQLNIADDYFKAKNQISLLEEELHR